MDGLGLWVWRKKLQKVFEVAEHFSESNHTDLLIFQVKEVFSGVELGDGISLMEALEIDSHSTDAVCLKARQEDIGQCWESYTPDRLRGTFAALAFLDPLGMRFYLPAFLIAELKGDLDEELVWHLCRVDRAFSRRFSALCNVQRKVVCQVLSHFASLNSYRPQRLMLERALKDYWSTDGYLGPVDAH